MNDPVEMAKARAYRDLGAPTGFDSGEIRVPGRSRRTFNEDSSLHERGDRQDHLLNLTDATVDSLDQEAKDKLLKELLDNNRNQSEKKRALELRSDEIDLNNKQRFSDLGLYLAKAFSAFAAVIVFCLVAVVIYAVVFDKSIIDSAFVTGFLSTFETVFKALFSSF